MRNTARGVEHVALRTASCLFVVALLGIGQDQHPSLAQADGEEISSYENSVLADEPTAYYRLDEAGGTSMLDASGHSHTGAFGANVVHGTPGAVGDGDSAATFDGTTASASAALDLSGTSVITTEFWLNWSGTPGDDRLAAEFTDGSSPFYATSGSFYLSPDSAWDQGFEVSMGDGSGVRFSGGKFIRPTAGAWHHYAIVLDRGSGTIKPYVDGVLQPFTYSVTGTSTTNFGNLTLDLMSGLSSPHLGQGTLDEFAIYPRALSLTQITSHFVASGRTVATDTPSANPVTQVTAGATTRSVSPTSLGTSAFLPNSMSGEYGWAEQRSSVGNPIVDVAQRFTWSDVEPNGPGENEGWSTLHRWIDTHLAVAQARGGRLLTGGPAYMNPPEPGGVPAWVYANPASNSIQVSGYGTSFWVPDCNSEFYLHRMELLFAEIGRYVADKPAWGFFSNHTVGSFGEWHFFPFSDVAPITFPAHGPNGLNTYANDASIKRLNDAMINNLHHPERGEFAAVMAESTGTPPTMASRDFFQAMSNIYPNTVATQNDAFGSVELAGAADIIIQVARWRTAPLLVEGFANPSDIGNSDSDPNLMNTWEQMTRTLHVSMVSGGLIKQGYVHNFLSTYQKMINEAGYRYQIDSVTLPKTITRGVGFTLSSVWENLNVAPTYDPWVIAWQLRRQSDGVQVWEGLSTYNLTAITDSSLGSVTVTDGGLTVPSSVPPGEYDVRVMVRTSSTLPYLPPMHLNMSGRESDGSYSLGSVEVS